MMDHSVTMDENRWVVATDGKAKWILTHTDFSINHDGCQQNNSIIYAAT